MTPIMWITWATATVLALHLVWNGDKASQRAWWMTFWISVALLIAFIVLGMMSMAG